MEIWKDIKGFEGLYQISNLGRVKSFNFWNGRKYLTKEKIIKGWVRKPNKNWNYQCLIVNLSKNKTRNAFRVHRLVAETFIPNPDNKPEINHIDFNPLNNRVDNLEWCTHKENMNWSAKSGRMRKLDTLQEKQIIKLYKNKTPFSEIEKKFSISKTTIYTILNKYNINKNMKKNGKYKINLEFLLEDFKRGFKNCELVKKYNCSEEIIGTRKYQFRKRGLL